MAPDESACYKIRFSAEQRANSRLKEDFSANNVMVKGHAKVSLHLMFGVITLFSESTFTAAWLHGSLFLGEDISFCDTLCRTHERNDSGIFGPSF